MALPKTRLDKLVQLRQRSEDRALAKLADAQSLLGLAQRKLTGAIQQARVDQRHRGQAALWAVEEAAHGRALQAVHVAQGQVSHASAGKQVAQDGYVAARQKAEAARRAVERKRAEILREHEKAERKKLDELAALRFAAGR